MASSPADLEGKSILRSVIFNVDGTLVDSVDLHALAWHEAFAHFGHEVTFEQARGQIGKGGDQLLPVLLSETDRRNHGDRLEEWRGKRYKTKYLPLVRPFTAVPDLLGHIRERGVGIAVASSAKRPELDTYLEIACVRDLADIAISSEDAKRSKPSPDIFEATLAKLGTGGQEAMAVGYTPYDAEAAGKAGISTIGFLCGGFTKGDLLEGGCVAVYPGPAKLLACFSRSPLFVPKAK